MSLLRQQGPTAAVPLPRPTPQGGGAQAAGRKAGRRTGRLSGRTRHKAMGLLLVTPFGLLFLAFLVAPLVYAFWLSLRTSTLVGGDHFSWFTNYKQTFTDPHFLSGVRRVIVFGLVQIPVMLGLALLGALIIDEVSSRLAKVFRMTLFMPYAVPAVIGALMWGFLYSPTFGPVNSLSHALGLGKVGLLGHSLMLTSLGNIVTWQWTGDSVNTYAVNDLVAVVDAVEDKEAAELAAEYVESYDVVPALRPGGIRHDSLLYAARLELGLRGFLTEGGFTAFTTNFEDLGGLRQLPGIAVQRLMADGYGFGGEGDWKTSALLRTMKVMGAGRPGGTSFMEDYTYHLGPGTPRVLGAHMLEVCPSVAADRPRCEIHPLSIGGREDPVRLVFDAAEGPAVVVGLSDLGDRFRLTANAVDVMAPSQPLPHLPVARAVWKPRPSLAESAESWLLAGAPHHTVLSSAVDLETLTDFAAMAGVELLTIDENTTSDRLAKEIRWNAAYHRLAQAL
ncbi:hypothetical protein PV416_46725 [Streptomyces ipomoeae]|uniref:L-arabinose isomerase n=1 Tax=Streptomyces ipomoeae 91-03 TaxID=698759 RepID=L1L5M4_9ACTN|nr:L-arabinose isomerase [Streptomyces ipomoeae]EKX68227.1 L-arabinose isomerase [Streptomyces ipomoeae 91-03]MDX2700675.1 hypothetical protein [Streptomyces ipomoeae]MDX2828348.1 hypothetical protein [Streptomyces ipomoeae]MDX2846334.1 hypothetical protein [Streptomyces ipomoeae]MDX2880849.1 hypothetical protein [Streptomyces ipomoeae]